MKLVGVSRTGHFLTHTQRQRDKNSNLVEYYNIVVSKKMPKFVNCRKFENLVCWVREGEGRVVGKWKLA